MSIRESFRDSFRGDIRQGVVDGNPVCFIPLTHGAVAVIDAADLPLVAPYKWHLSAKGYARHTHRIPGAERGKVGIIMMHRLIAGDPAGVLVDHENRVRTDNRRRNLRQATRCGNSQNVTSKKQREGGFKGVTLAPSGRFAAAARVGPVEANGRRKIVHLGRFDTAELAARAYDRAASEAFGEFASLNFPRAAGPGVVAANHQSTRLVKQPTRLVKESA
jgi:hypothetical protein